MFSIDVPYIPSQDSPVVLAHTSVAQIASVDAITRQKFDKIFKNCFDVENTIGAAERPFNEFPLLPGILERLGYRWDGANYNVPPDVEAQIKSSVIETPKHGKVTLVDAKYHIWAYESDPNYLGKDRVSFVVEANGKRFKIVLDLAVVQGINESDDPACIKMFNLTIEGLPNGALGEVRGNGGDAKITLDDNAAGHGWFIDVTPGANEEFLPTSNPNVWVARPGSAAARKMDMLSVLMHEYGHVLDLEHSADARDAMASVLQSSVRKLWSESDLAKLNEIRGWPRAIAASLPDQNDQPVDRQSDGLPPTGQQRTTTQLGRARRLPGAGIDPEANTGNDAQALHAINSTLTNGSFQTADTWETSGAVELANGTATLSESARQQSQPA